MLIMFCRLFALNTSLTHKLRRKKVTGTSCTLSGYVCQAIWLNPISTHEQTQSLLALVEIMQISCSAIKIANKLEQTSIVRCHDSTAQPRSTLAVTFHKPPPFSRELARPVLETKPGRTETCLMLIGNPKYERSSPPSTVFVCAV